MPAATDKFASELASGAGDGLTEDRETLHRMIGLIQAWLARDPEDWPMVAAIRNGYLDDAVRAGLIRDVTKVITGELAPAYTRLAATLDARVLPVAREVEGLAGLAIGPACYAALIRYHTTLAMTAADLHALGLAEVARVEGEMMALGRELYGVDSWTAIAGRLDGDSSQRFNSEAEILTWAKGTIARARERVEPVFASFPKAPLAIVPYPAEYGQISASYWSSPDGIQPARYFLVTQPPRSQARWVMESTTFHEAIPGHHMQVGRAVELTRLPLLRRLFNDTAFVEGWGLYAETLAGELDLYSDGPARLGRLTNEALRACRLVIDTGLHDLGWTRAQADTFLKEHSLYGDPYVSNEIERYLGNPGQALAYEVGELELLRLRAGVQARDGSAFSLRDFHEAVIGEGSLPLPILAERLLGESGAARGVQLGDLRVSARTARASLVSFGSGGSLVSPR